MGPVNALINTAVASLALKYGVLPKNFNVN